MKQNAGVIAVLMVVLTFFGITSLPRTSTGGDTTVEQRAKPNPKSKVQQKPKSNTASQTTRRSPRARHAACDEIRSRLLPFVADGALEDQRLPASCYDEHEYDAATDPMKPEMASLDLNFVIATVPDPISTHLPLMFDRMIEVIQQAAQDDGYSYDSSWFPWHESSKDDLSDQGTADEVQHKQQEQPGIVVFRRSMAHQQDASPFDQGLVVFVVAEQPTGGIDTKEFSNALLWIERLGDLKPGRFRGILGPTFSGSIPSLARAISPHISAFNSQTPLRISSGSVSSETSYRWFQNYLSGHGLFQTASEGDTLMVNRFCDYIQSQGYDRSRIALVSEDETAFGAIAEPNDKDNVAAATKSTKPDNPLCYSAPPSRDSLPKKSSPPSTDGERQGPVYLYYPRDIATCARLMSNNRSSLRSHKPHVAILRRQHCVAI